MSEELSDRASDATPFDPRAPDDPRTGAAGPDASLRAHWRDLVGRRLPEAAGVRPHWPVRLDHCFARILLDNACGGPWRDHVAPPAWRTMPPDRLAAAVDLGEAVLADRVDLTLLNDRSLEWRGKTRGKTGRRNATGSKRCS